MCYSQILNRFDAEHDNRSIQHLTEKALQIKTPSNGVHRNLLIESQHEKNPEGSIHKNMKTGTKHSAIKAAFLSESC